MNKTGAIWPPRVQGTALATIASKCWPQPGATEPGKVGLCAKMNFAQVWAEENARSGLGRHQGRIGPSGRRAARWLGLPQMGKCRGLASGQPRQVYIKSLRITLTAPSLSRVQMNWGDWITVRRSSVNLYSVVGGTCAISPLSLWKIRPNWEA